MLIGILSDSHGKHLMVRRAVELFTRLGVEHVIHCGDVCGEYIFDELADRPLTFVWGNMDIVDSGTLAYVKTLLIAPPNEIPTLVELSGKQFAVFHGHEREFERAQAAGFANLNVDYVLHGHTHVARDERFGAVRVINPGALHRASRKTVAVLDTRGDDLQYHEVPAD